MPGSTSTNAPKEVRFRTGPVMWVPGGYLAGRESHGSSSVCFIPREIFCSSSSTRSTTHSISSPIDTSCEGCRTLRVQLISEMWTRPSTPFSSSTKAP